ncbi:MAG: helix-turn-helix domain-containing protein [Lachnospiraceae bacterium]|nr:helix-turn-helix domain-containing protein [Lachnospiraceae bacterium]
MSAKIADAVLMGQRIKEQRTLKGYSREKLAELADITPRFCYDIELGSKNMSLHTLCNIAAALSIPADYILFGPQSADDRYTPVTALIRTCPPDYLDHLTQIVSHFIQAVQKMEEE